MDHYGEIVHAEGNVWNSRYRHAAGHGYPVIRPERSGIGNYAGDRWKDGRYQAFAWKGALKFLEFTGGDLTKLAYDAKDKIIDRGRRNPCVSSGPGRRAQDALVDPYTGMAYVVRDFDGTNGSRDQLRGQDGTGAGKTGACVAGQYSPGQLR